MSGCAYGYLLIAKRYCVHLFACLLVCSLLYYWVLLVLFGRSFLEADLSVTLFEVFLYTKEQKLQSAKISEIQYTS